MMLYGEKNMENKGEMELCKIKFERGNLLGKKQEKRSNVCQEKVHIGNYDILQEIGHFFRKAGTVAGIWFYFDKYLQPSLHNIHIRTVYIGHALLQLYSMKYLFA